MNKQIYKIRKNIIRINYELYFLDFNDTNFQLQELVMDARDLCYGIIDCFQGQSHVALQDGCVVNVGVPLNEIVKLKKHHPDFVHRN